MPFSIQFLGVGGAFSLPSIPGDLTTSPMQSNMVITANNGKRMLFDCGTDIRFSAQLCGFDYDSFDAVYISHEHADHAGGLEWLLLNRLFSDKEKPLLFAELQLFWRLWEKLRSGLMVTPTGIKRFGHYVVAKQVCFDQTRGLYGATFWENLRIQLYKNIHVRHATKPMLSYGTVISNGTSSVYISADTVFDDQQILRIAREPAVTIFHDCEVGFKTDFHTHYDELLTLPPAVRAKMWLYHYNPAEAAKRDPQADEFLGFVKQGQTFNFS